MSSSRRIILQSCYARSYRIEAAVYVLVSAVYLFYVVYAAGALGAHGGYQHGYSGPDIGRYHIGGTQGMGMCLSYDYGPVRVARMICAPMSMSLSTKKRRLSNIF